MDFKSAFESLTGYPPFRWQARLYADHFSKGEIPAALDLPTGLGKTSVMAIWLIARALGATLPRRLVYVVDRRAVVDQATAEAEKLRAALDGAASEFRGKLGLSDRSLPISTLRGQFVDNRDWLADPAVPAIIVGTVDMIGSRLLFEGYGVSRKMRPYHAGLLGADTLVVLDEAHLVPPFEKLLEAIEKGVSADYAENRQCALGPKNANNRKIVPPFRLLSLSATGREREGKPFRLFDDDHNDEIVKKRLNANKALSIKPLEDKQTIENALAETAWGLVKNGEPIRCLIYCDKRETAQKVFDDLCKRSAPAKKGTERTASVELFTGARRFFEREETTTRLIEPLGFVAGKTNETGKPAFLVATSAAEVGVDLDADHMVCDLVAWERMVQRLGRVNRRGEGDATVVVIDPGERKPKKPDELTEAEKRAVLAYKSLAVIKALRRPAVANDARDASPASLVDLKQRAASDASLCVAIDAATTLATLRPALTRALIDAWSMTSLEKHTGRPEVAPWLRGWVDEDGPQTAVVWRTHLPVRTEGGDAADKEVEAFFEAAPPHVSEKLETESYAVVDWLIKRAAGLLGAKSKASDSSENGAGEIAPEAAPLAEAADDSPETQPCALAADDIVAFALTPARELKRVYRLRDFSGEKKDKEALQRELAFATLVIDARFGGLSGGLLAEIDSGTPRTADDGDEWIDAPPAKDGTKEPLIKFRVRSGKDQEPDADVELDQAADSEWRETFRFHAELNEEGKPTRSLIVEKWRGASTNENEKSISKRAQSLSEHKDWTATAARKIAHALRLPDDYESMLVAAARMHDDGKSRELWQRAMGKPKPHKSNPDANWPYAKTEGRGLNLQLLKINGETFRHEFASVYDAEKCGILEPLPPHLRDLALHLIAAHHGYARPVIAPIDPDAPPSALQQRACDVALRFARLQKQWGPWGLAWWEALLRAADQQASRENDEAGRTEQKRKEGRA